MDFKTIFISAGMMIFFSSAMAAAKENCSAILAKPSPSWITQAGEKNGGSTVATVAAISLYARCIDQNAQQIYAQLLKSGNYPLMGANANFRDFSAALQNFTDLALKATATGGTWDEIQTAYAQLYQRQFKILFYAEYSTDIQNLLLNRLKNTKKPRLENSKAYFEKIIQHFPATQRQALLHSFNQLISIADTENHFDKSYIYNYAIFILQSPADSPFSEPPF